MGSTCRREKITEAVRLGERKRGHFFSSWGNVLNRKPAEGDGWFGLVLALEEARNIKGGN